MQKYIKSKYTALKYATLVCLASLCVESLAMEKVHGLEKEDACYSALPDPNSKPAPLGSDVSSSILFKRWQQQSSRRYTVPEKANPGDRHGENKLEASQLSIIPEECEKWELTAENLAKFDSDNVPAEESEDSTKSINSFFSDKPPQKWCENIGPLTREHMKELHDDCKAKLKETYNHVNQIANGSKEICKALMEALITLDESIYTLQDKSRDIVFVESFVINYKTALLYLALAKLFHDSHHAYENLQKPLSELMKVFNATDTEKLFDKIFSSNVDHEEKWSKLLENTVCKWDIMPYTSKLIKKLRRGWNYANRTLTQDQGRNMLTPIQSILNSFGRTPAFATRLPEAQQLLYALDRLGYDIEALKEPGAELKLKPPYSDVLDLYLSHSMSLV